MTNDLDTPVLPSTIYVDGKEVGTSSYVAGHDDPFASEAGEVLEIRPFTRELLVSWPILRPDGTLLRYSKEWMPAEDVWVVC